MTLDNKPGLIESLNKKKFKYGFNCVQFQTLYEFNILKKTSFKLHLSCCKRIRQYLYKNLVH